MVVCGLGRGADSLGPQLLPSMGALSAHLLFPGKTVALAECSLQEMLKDSFQEQAKCFYSFRILHLEEKHVL